MSHHNIKVKTFVAHDVFDAAISVLKLTQTFIEHFKLLVHLVNRHVGILDVDGSAWTDFLAYLGVFALFARSNLDVEASIFFVIRVAH